MEENLIQDNWVVDPMTSLSETESSWNTKTMDNWQSSTGGNVRRYNKSIGTNFTKYDPYVRSTKEQTEMGRYLNQPNSVKFGNALRNTGAELVLGSLKAITDIPDIFINIGEIASSNGDELFENPISKALGDYKKEFKESNKVYQDPTDKFKPTSFSWWMGNLDSIASAATYIIPSKAIGMGSIKLLTALSKAKNLSRRTAQVTAALSASLYTTSHEAVGSIRETMPQIIQKAMVGGMEYEEAREFAAKEAQRMYTTNVGLNVLPEMMGMSMLFKSMGATRNIVNRKSLFAGIGSREIFKKEVLQEVFQEGVNVFSEKNSLRKLDMKLGNTEIEYSLSELIKDPDAQTAMFFGGLGGGVFSRGGAAVNQGMQNAADPERSIMEDVFKSFMTGKTKQELDLYDKQQEIISDYVKTLDTLNQLDTIAEYSGNAELKEKVSKMLLRQEVLKNFALGTTENFFSTLDTMDSTLDTFAEQGEDVSELKENIQTIREEANYMEKLYNDTYQTYSDISQESLFNYVNNEMDIKYLEDSINEFESTYKNILTKDEKGIYSGTQKEKELISQLNTYSKELLGLEHAYSRTKNSPLENNEEKLDRIKELKKEINTIEEQLQDIKSPEAVLLLEKTRASMELIKLQEKSKKFLDGTYDEELKKIEEEIDNDPIGYALKKQIEDLAKQMQNESLLSDLIDDANNEKVVSTDGENLGLSELKEFILSLDTNLSTDAKLHLIDILNKKEVEYIQSKAVEIEHLFNEFRKDVNEYRTPRGEEILEEDKLTLDEVKNGILAGNLSFFLPYAENFASEALIELQAIANEMNSFESLKDKTLNSTGKNRKLNSENIEDIKNSIITQRLENTLEDLYDDLVTESKYFENLSKYNLYKKYFTDEMFNELFEEIKERLDDIEKELKDLSKQEELAQTKAEKDFINRYGVEKESDIDNLDSQNLQDDINTFGKQLRDLIVRYLKELRTSDYNINFIFNGDNDGRLEYDNPLALLFSVINLKNATRDSKKMKNFKVSLNLEELKNMNLELGEEYSLLNDIIDLVKKVNNLNEQKALKESTKSYTDIIKAEDKLTEEGKIIKAPFRQQINAIRQLVINFFSKNRKYSYLQGIAGSGKGSTVITNTVKIIKKLGSLDNSKITVVAPGSKANNVINQQVFGEENNIDYFKDNESIDRLIELVKDRKLLIVDEIGKIEESALKRLIEGTKDYDVKIIFTGDPNQKMKSKIFFLLQARLNSPYYGKINLVDSLTISQRSGNYNILSAQNKFLNAKGQKPEMVTVSHNTDHTEGVSLFENSDIEFFNILKKKLENKEQVLIIVPDVNANQYKAYVRSKVGKDVEIQSISESQGQESENVFMFAPYLSNSDSTFDTISEPHSTANTDLYVGLSRAISYASVFMGEVNFPILNNEIEVVKTDESSEKLTEKFKQRSEDYKKELKNYLKESNPKTTDDEFKAATDEEFTTEPNEEEINSEEGKEVVIIEEEEIAEESAEEEIVEEEAVEEEIIEKVVEEPEVKEERIKEQEKKIEEEELELIILQEQQKELEEELAVLKELINIPNTTEESSLKEAKNENTELIKTELTEEEEAYLAKEKSKHKKLKELGLDVIIPTDEEIINHFKTCKQ